jgi:hypothetical protein
MREEKEIAYTYFWKNKSTKKKMTEGYRHYLDRHPS